ncbi:MAG: peptidase M3A and M3B thimet/oligopeptidase F [Candidatus Edwardsbacteria bacterium RIFOXYD12_FULL_50_11]|uniref:Peptidase M3A and M3B thimet/oligopeptidase F n=1 Tax=Candidatus Edwardsbacteria bacterium GWF2_54_11 TaxID=1817851 RepID=A0A1F5RD22_9BACT|nr:MAG: peptidase M3A and M3B thimet/oligopeptidase F [Candidatus Edwardsbacteria bacterium RifOxyC12_full_54_24]OGF07430.1 MAG: peptidase M3A and M3B thimet/oligopeptidase F [Candidatus Edwardsbacteria bacterium RifOxyA12_full_54_48]OGF09681.1 MAG: peptidase M3A and M3B thimet/oligopeptidase F [Candidatus Edwardsbacteria bacterium GWE2_54_12]OGF11943.1 MAG: peptidase M3A and M3B thimet/oligopeptidase F [Candidatus Edwardsbacteria bacterium GWF2_54_11]OGF18125.1 MAG: peptidase M3A and M3B thime
MSQIKKLSAIGRKLEKLSAQYYRLEWVQYTTGYDFGSQKAYQRMVKVFKDQKNYQAILDHQAMDLEPQDKRRKEILYKAFKPYHLSDQMNQLELEIQKLATQLSQVLNTHRSNLDGREIRSTEIAQILRSQPDREKRKKAYLARAQVNQPLFQAGFAELIGLRKEYARLYGAKNFAAYQLEQQELDASMFDGWPEQTAKLLPAMKKIKAEFGEKFIGDTEVKPWDEAYISAQLAPELNHRVDMSAGYDVVRDFFLNFGWDITKYNITYDIFPRRNKSEWGYNFPIQTAKDSRILANVENRYHEYGVLLHETGHALHSFLLKPREVLLNLGVSGIISEGFANLFQDFLYDRSFYGQFFGEDQAGAAENFGNLKRWERATRLEAVPAILFDQALYRENIKTIDDVHQLYWKTYRQILGEEPFAGEPPWGFRIHHTTHPIYLHNYFMGDLSCDMLREVFKQRHKTDDIMGQGKKFGKFLMEEVIKPSGTYTYPELYKRISGEEFSLKYLAE